MDQFIVTLEPGADKALLRKMIKNFKGIGEVILKRDSSPKPKTKTKSSKKVDKTTEAWIKEMRDLSNSFDSSVVDLNDERTRYILKI